MSDSPKTLSERSDQALKDEFLRSAVRFTAERLTQAKSLGTEALGSWEDWRLRGEAVRAHTIENLDYYLDQWARKCEAAGAIVHFAADGAEAAQICLEIAKARGVRLAAKSKSMVTEEVNLNHVLGAAGIDVVETDLGEWIVQLAGETPSHIILPAIHKRRGQIRQLFEQEGGTSLEEDTKSLADHARRRLREKFFAADMGISGCNFAVAETGSIAIFTNEGNGRMVTSIPAVHVAFLGMERIVPTLADLELMVHLLPRSATGQKITTYLNIITGPRRLGETDGPKELHIIVLDNGRSRQLGDPDFQSVLHCIRCGACLNVCPVYRQVGGHAYGSVYPGPIGAVLTPLLAPDSKAAVEVAQASSLCGACFEACPVRIPLHDQLVKLRVRHAATTNTSWRERVALAVASWALRKPWRYRLMGRAGRFLQRMTIRDGTRMSWLVKRLPFVSGWAKQRRVPEVAKKSFTELWNGGEV